jgi:hypothetical protein
MTLDAVEFLRRFCLHILPKGFRKIRHWGMPASRNKEKLKSQQKKMKLPETCNQKPVYTRGFFDKKQCPYCKTGTMETLWSFRANAPPNILTKNKKTVLKSNS